MVESLDPQAFIDSYGLDMPVKTPSGMEITLGQALQLETMFCKPKDEADRTDPVKRVKWLATALAGADSLRVEHSYLIEDSE